MNTPVNFEIAKLLKEKGYNQWSAKWYSVEGSCYNENEFDNCRGYIPTEDCNAPTIAEVVMWLYEKHGIWVYISDNSARLGFRYQIQRLKNLGENNFSSERKFNSPTEAYTAAIEYTLKNLIK